MNRDCFAYEPFSELERQRREFRADIPTGILGERYVSHDLQDAGWQVYEVGRGELPNGTLYVTVTIKSREGIEVTGAGKDWIIALHAAEARVREHIPRRRQGVSNG